MIMDEMMEKILAILPDAIFDKEYRTGEIMISTGLVSDLNGVLRKVDDVLGEG